jgi:hypothetical protein
MEHYGGSGLAPAACCGASHGAAPGLIPYPTCPARSLGTGRDIPIIIMLNQDRTRLR